MAITSFQFINIYLTEKAGAGNSNLRYTTYLAFNVDNIGAGSHPSNGTPCI